MALKSFYTFYFTQFWIIHQQSERSQNFRYKVTAVFVGGLFSEGVAKGSRRQQMRCRLILLITEHPIQQGIRKGGVRHFGHGRGRGRTDRRTEWRILGSWMLGLLCSLSLSLPCLCICLCLCLCQHCMIEVIVLFSAIFHMRDLTWSWDDLFRL